MKKRTATAFAAMSLVFGLSVGAYAASNNEAIKATLNRDITITYNGAKQTFVDVNGNTVYPISYNGTTYLPVRAVSNLLNLPVVWDGAANTVRLGTDEKQPVNLVNQSNSGGTKYSWIITDPSELKFSGSDGIQEFGNGVIWDQWNSTMSFAKERVISFDVSGYSQISFTAAADVRAKVTLYDQDFKAITNFELQKGDMVSKKINLNGATRIAFASNYPSIVDAVKDQTDGYIYFYDVTLN